MKRETFKISRPEGMVNVLGWTFTKDGLDIGIDKRKSPINSDIWWYVTELSTGLRLPFKYATRKNALDGLDAWLYKIKEILQQKKTA